MKCPKCSHENSDDTLFCEECDHRLDQPFKQRTATISPLIASMAALALGICSVVTFNFAEYLVPVILGALGLFIGSYSLTVSRRSDTKNKMLFMIAAGAAMALSVIGFVWGITLL